MAFNDTYRESIQTKHIANVGFTSTAKGVTNEAFALKNPHQIIASQIPAVDVVGTNGPLVASGIAAGLVEKHTVKLTADPTVNGNKAWIAYETNCTETGHSDRGDIRLGQWMRYAETQYKLRLYQDTGANAPDYTKEILPSEANFNWEYDASAGIVYFDTDPAGTKTTPLWGELYTYIGQTVEDGLGATSSGVEEVVALLADHHDPDSTDHDDRYYTEVETDTLLTTLSGNLQEQITGKDEFIELTDTMSSYNEGRILFESSDAVVDAAAFIFRVAEQTLEVPNMVLSGNATVSGTFGFDQTTTVDEITLAVSSASTDSQLPTAKAVYTNISTASGTLQGQIDQNASDISDLDSELTTASGYLQSQISQNASDISDLDAELTTASGYLQTQITNNYNTLDGKIDTTSGTLQGQLDQLDTDLTDAIIWEVVDTPFEQIRPKVEHQGKAIYTAGNLTIGGDLTVSGTTTTINSEELTVTDKMITVNNGEVGAGLTGDQYAGIEVDRGSEADYLFVFDEVQDNFRVGISGSLQAVATREDTPVDGNIAVWNSTEVRFDTTGTLALTDIATEEFVSTAITTLSGVLQGDIDQAIEDLANNYYNKTEIDIINTTISGVLQGEVNDVASDLANNYYTISELDSGQLDNRYYTETEADIFHNTLQSGIDAINADLSNYYTKTELDLGQLDNRYYTETEADLFHTTLSGALQSNIDFNYSELDSKIDTTSGTLQSEITNNYNTLNTTISTASGTLQTQITNNYNTLSDVISTASGTLQTQITNNYNTLDDKIDTTSGTLQAAINELGEARDEFIELTDTISTYNAGRILFESDDAVVDDAAFTFVSGTQTLTTVNLSLSGNATIDGTFGFDTGTTINEFVTTIDVSSTDDQAPTAKAVFDFTSTAITTVSGVLQGELDLLDEKIDTTSGTLQSSITNNYNTLDGKIDTTSGTLQSSITNNYNTLDSKIDTTSGTLQTFITNNYNTLDEKIDTTSGTLQAAINELDGDLTDAIIWEVVDTPFEQIRPKVEHQGKAIYTAGNLTIGGDLTVSGTTTTINSEELTVTDKMITVNNGEAGNGLTGDQYAGIEVDRGVEENYLFVFDEVQDNFRVGISGSLQAVATREDTPVDGNIAVWNSAEVRFDTTGTLALTDIATEEYVTTAITTLSGVLQGDIDQAIEDLANNYYNKTEIDLMDASLSGTLQSGINSVASDLANNYYTISELDNGQLDNRYYTESEADAQHTVLSGSISDVASDLSMNYYTITALDNGQLDNRYYTETEINSMLQAQDTFLELTDTIASYNAGRVLFTTASGVVDSSVFSFDSDTGVLSIPALELETGGYINEVVTTITSGTTNTQIPTAKAVWDLTEAAAAAVHTHYDVDATYVSDTSWTYGTGLSEVPEALIICVNGVKQRIGASYDCSVDVPGGVLTITFAYNVYSTDWVNVSYIL